MFHSNIRHGFISATTRLQAGPVTNHGSVTADRFWGPPSLVINWYGIALSLALRRPDSEANKGFISRTKAKNE